MSCPKCGNPEMGEVYSVKRGITLYHYCHRCGYKEEEGRNAL